MRPEISRTAHNMRLAGKGSSGFVLKPISTFFFIGFRFFNLTLLFSGLYKKIINDIKFSEKKVDFSLIPVEDMVKERSVL